MPSSHEICMCVLACDSEQWDEGEGRAGLRMEAGSREEGRKGRCSEDERHEAGASTHRQRRMWSSCTSECMSDAEAIRSAACILL